MNFFRRIIAVLCLIFVMIFKNAASDDNLKVKGVAIPITQPRNRFFHPKWSPDGKMIAVTGDNYRGIWVMNTHGNKLRKLSNDKRVGYGLQWSGDSKEIACRTTTIIKKRRLGAIKIINIKTGLSRLVSDFRPLIGIPGWADRDQKICFTVDDKLRIISSERQIRFKKQNANKNEILLYQSYGRIIISDLAQNNKSILVDPDSRFLNASLSPDKKKIAFEMTNGRIYVMNIDGTHIVDLGYGSHPRWAPNGKRLVYYVSRDDGKKVVASDLYIINIAGTERIQLTNTKERVEMNPDWSPDGKRIVFDEYKTGIIYQVKVQEVHVVPPMR